MMTTKEMVIYDEMVDMGLATAEEMNLVKNIHGGSWQAVFDSICEVRTGLNFKQYIEELMEEE